MTKMRIIAGDIGGSHLTVALFEKIGKDLKLQKTKRASVDSRLGKSEILKSWFDEINSLVGSFEDVYISLAMPAPFDYSEGICLIQEQGKFLSLYGVNIKKELCKELGIPENYIKFINDAEAFLYGESLFGKGRGIDSILGITLGSGLGSALKKGRDIRDASLWNFPFKEGIVEDYLGSNWFLSQAQKIIGIKATGVKELIDVLGDSEVLKEIFSEFASNLSEFIIQQYEIHHFDHVIISGSISRSAYLFQEQLRSNLSKSGLSIPFEVSLLGENAALFGAAAVFFEDIKDIKIIVT